MKDNLIGILKSGPMTVKELPEETDKSEAIVRTELNRHKGDLFIKMAKEWGLKENESYHST